MTVSERILFIGLLLPLQEGYTYSCDRRTTDGMELLFIFREDGRSRYYFESEMQELLWSSFFVTLCSINIYL